jgi:hypothetical protein
MQIKSICPDSGREYLGVTRAEVHAIVDIISQVLHAHPIGERRLPQLISAWFLRYCTILVDDDDITVAEIGSLADEAQSAGIGVPPAILTPGKTCERYRGTYGSEQYQWLRRYKHARWMIERFQHNGIDIGREYGDLPTWYFVGEAGMLPDVILPPLPEGASLSERIKRLRQTRRPTPPNVSWFEIKAEPQIAVMRIVLEKNRTTERNKRKNSRQRNNVEKLRAAGYEYRGYRGLVKIADAD